jgi:hypothetical protein
MDDLLEFTAEPASAVEACKCAMHERKRFTHVENG